MMVYVWNVNYCEYVFTDESSSGAKLSILHWDCEGYDDATPGYQHARAIGTEDVTDQDITGSVDELRQTAERTLVDILLDGMGPEDQKNVEDNLARQYQAIVKPPGGGFAPPTPEDPVTP